MELDHGTATMSRAFGNSAEQTEASVCAQAAASSSHPTRASGTTMRVKQNRFDISGTKEFKLQELAMLSIAPIVRSIHHWWLQRAEEHYLICADVEQQRAREAQMNVAYYQKRAALARSARN
ncbi:MAG TPA: hypothetical protein VJ698_16675 [Noviherbaspirillum sp.]|uniref:hypothetical protein n=1 Tax=Noviherbaspirillum sp. TaxID=1926288 RepID=UPI002B486B2B|nr:hypothetical protein [Noviherbaspirillum sp.]HJV87101.1 hypothetical protein [Noviherbaspirillum sp.]